MNGEVEESHVYLSTHEMGVVEHSSCKGDVHVGYVMD
jgi:hypothetical protein